jgi:hypothetical protein
VPVGNGWNSPVNNAQWGTDYLNRAGTAKSNMYDNRPNETRYIYTAKDFWSLTLYNQEHVFHPSSLNRYSLGTKSRGLTPNAKSPGRDKESRS